jgi:hypothetical protein
LLPLRVNVCVQKAQSKLIVIVASSPDWNCRSAARWDGVRTSKLTPLSGPAITVRVG